PIALCDQLPFVVFRHNDRSQDEVNEWLKTIYSRLRRQDDCFELAVQRNLSRVFEYLFRNFERLPKTEVSRIQITAQVRIQKMLSYIYENYSNTVTLEDIARAANISRSEAGRSFHAYMGCSPVDALIQYRLQIAHALLDDKSLTLEEISCACGFHSVRYFNRQFKKKYGCTPHELRRLGK
ncbi:helix-turn-helix transcriptional regulator, partial [Massilicoli timonensis]|uniref:AraC family transcriptional regulator n=1 Tax=Massilicoli timonensis TaxID=2015901 RepID=UPI003AACC86A